MRKVIARSERDVFAAIAAAVPTFIQAVDPDLRWLAVNSAAATEFERIFGIRPTGGASALEALAAFPAQRDFIERCWRRALAGEAFIETAVLGDPEGLARSYEMKFQPLRAAAGESIGAFQFAIDVTERLRNRARRAEMEEALRQAQRLETVGQLSGGVAHDFNNLLQIVTGNLDVLRVALAQASDPVQRALRSATNGAERAATLTQRLLAFSRRQPLDPLPLDANRLIDRMQEMFRHTLGDAVVIHLLPDAALWPIEADATQLEIALLNLVLNSRDAMTSGGRLTIETANTLLDFSGAVRADEVRPGRYICIRVSDTGCGMDAETRLHAIEPFFTTKEVGKGTGLGLSMVYGFVKQSGGHVRLESEPGKGTTVRIYLPQWIEPTGSGADVASDSSDPPPEGSRVGMPKPQRLP